MSAALVYGICEIWDLRRRPFQVERRLFGNRVDESKPIAFDLIWFEEDGTTTLS
jgi:hypothetical protein